MNNALHLPHKGGDGQLVDPVQREAETCDGETNGLIILPEPLCLAFPECPITSTSQFSVLPVDTLEIGLCHLQHRIWARTVPLKEEMENGYLSCTKRS